MILREYRIPFPCSVQEYRVGMNYMIERCTAEENSGGQEQVTLVECRSYGRENMHGLPAGVYTEKHLHVGEFLPAFLRCVVPRRGLTLVEKSWNSYPERCVTQYESPWLGTRFHLSVDSRYIGDDRGDHPNALALSSADLAAREVVTLDIAGPQHLDTTTRDIDEPFDARVFQSKVTNRPCLGDGGIWIREHEPIMCCYKVVRVNIDSQFLPNKRVEQWTHTIGLQRSFLRYNRKVLRWIDSWFAQTINSPNHNPNITSHVPSPPEKNTNRNATAIPILAVSPLEKHCQESRLLGIFDQAYRTDPFCS